MALPAPNIINAYSAGLERTKFMLDGMGFDRFVATWPIALPPDPPDYDQTPEPPDDPWRRGDNAAVTHILYRVIENRTMPIPVAEIPDDIRNLIVADSTQYEMAWHQHLATDFWYQDAVFPVTEQGRHVAAMPTADTRWAINAKTKCYWVMAWLGVDDNDILVGYNAP